MPYAVDRTLIIIIMDDSCIAQIFQSRKLSALAHAIHADIHTDMNIIYTHTHTHTHTCTHTPHDLPIFVEMPVDKGKF